VRPDLGSRLRLVVITDRRLAAPSNVRDIVTAALGAGAEAIQLRDKTATPRELLDEARVLRTVTRGFGALLFVNDRLDVALAAGADGVHLGPADIPVSAVRRVTPRGFVVGFSTDDPDLAVMAEEQGADYIGCGAVFGTATKDVGDEAIGLEGLDRVARAVAIPVLGIGGVTPAGAARIARDTGAAGTAVIGAVMASADPGGAVAALLAPFRDRKRSHRDRL